MIHCQCRQQCYDINKQTNSCKLGYEAIFHLGDHSPIGAKAGYCYYRVNVAPSNLITDTRRTFRTRLWHQHYYHECKWRNMQAKKACTDLLKLPVCVGSDRLPRCAFLLQLVASLPKLLHARMWETDVRMAKLKCSKQKTSFIVSIQSDVNVCCICAYTSKLLYKTLPHCIYLCFLLFLMFYRTFTKSSISVQVFCVFYVLSIFSVSCQTKVGVSSVSAPLLLKWLVWVYR